MHSLGIDIASIKFDVCLLDVEENRVIGFSTFSNSKQGFVECEKWLEAKVPSIKDINAYMESTGDLELQCYDYFKSCLKEVLVLNPKQVNRFKEVLNIDQKTDKIDAEILARIVVIPQLKSSIKSTKSGESKLFETLGRQRDFLISERTQVSIRKQRLKRNQGAQLPAIILTQLDEQLKILDSQIEAIDAEIFEYIDKNDSFKKTFKCLKSIPGIGDVSGAVILQYVGERGVLFETAEKFCGYAGLYPTQHQSGKAKGQTFLTHKGNRRLRKTFYMCACAMITRTGMWKSYYESKLKTGKKPKQILIAMACKMAKLCWTLAHNQTSFERGKFMPNFA